MSHVAEGAREIADLVAAPAEIRNGDLPSVAAPHPLGGGSEAAHRPRDGAGKVERESDGDGKRDDEDLEDVEARRAYRLLEAAAADRQHDGTQHLLVALHRHGDGEKEPAARPVTPHLLGALAEKGALDLAEIRRLRGRDLMIFRQVGAG